MEKFKFSTIIHILHIVDKKDFSAVDKAIVDFVKKSKISENKIQIINI